MPAWELAHCHGCAELAHQVCGSPVQIATNNSKIDQLYKTGHELYTFGNDAAALASKVDSPPLPPPPLATAAHFCIRCARPCACLGCMDRVHAWIAWTTRMLEPLVWANYAA